MKKQLLFLILILSVYFVNAQIHVGPSLTYTSLSNAVNAGVVHAGDTVYLHAGTYNDNGADSLGGTYSHWITIRPYQNDSVKIVTQWTITNATYVKFYGLNFIGNDSAAWTNGTVYHQLFFNYNYACFTTLSNIIVDHCHFMKLLTGPNQYTTTNTAGNVSMKFTGTDTFQVTNCLFRGNAGSEGLSMNGDRNGIVKNNRFDPPAVGFGGWASHCKGGSSKITFEQNLYINWSLGGMDIGGSTGASFFCPLSYASIYEADSINFCSNITIGGQTCIRLASLSNSNIINNTCFKSNDFTVRLLVEDANVQFVNNKIYNNIFTIANTSNGFYINETGGWPYNTFLFYNNLFYSYSNPTMGLSSIYQDVGSTNPAVISGSVFGDPMFTDTTNMNFSLKAGSPAIGAGLNVPFPTTDYNGSLFNASARSIGAIEYDVGGVKDYEDANDITIYPNPSTGVFNVSWSGAGAIQTIKVFNAVGQLVHAEKPDNYSVKINLSGFSKGIYKVVFITNKENISTRTLVVK
ncbi:MAG: T9SS type A sorting domain-containing protein [Bacteroidales bacterium]|jgi:hypothetical protein